MSSNLNKAMPDSLFTHIEDIPFLPLVNGTYLINKQSNTKYLLLVEYVSDHALLKRKIVSDATDLNSIADIVNKIETLRPKDIIEDASIITPLMIIETE